MLTFAWYVFKVILCSGILFAYYSLALRNKKFHLYNRFYLLTAIMFSWIIPLLKIDFWENTTRQPQVIKLLTVVANGNQFVQEAEETFTWQQGFLIAFGIVSVIFIAKLLIALLRIRALIAKSRAKKWNNIHFVLTDAKGTPFSFFKYIFWNPKISLDTSEGAHILKHELAHVDERHTIDKLFIDIVLIIGWFNPFVWLIRKELYMIHEFIADKKAIQDGDTTAFASMLLKAAYPEYSFPLTNSFFYSPIKRRLLMLTSSKKTSFTYLRRIAILPLLMFTCLLFAFTIQKGKTRTPIPKTENTFSINNATEDQILKLQEQSNLEESNYQDTSLKKKGSKVTNITVPSTETKSIQFETERKVSGESDQQKFNEAQQKYMKEKQKQNEFIQKYKEAKEQYEAEQQQFAKFQQKYKEEALQAENETPAEFPGGALGWKRYLEENLNANITVANHAPAGLYTVMLQFTVHEDGTLSNIEAKTKPGYGTEEEAIKVIAKGPKWVPAKKGGSSIASVVKQAISFLVEKSNR